uniref:Uncharacterized protein n=1 Tax=Arundo donax TaxID=35708 RepID=A0A0A9BKQ1_ARUDO
MDGVIGKCFCSSFPLDLKNKVIKFRILPKCLGNIYTTEIQPYHTSDVQVV